MIDEGKIIVIDDFISLEYQQKIKDELLGLDNAFPWNYSEDVTGAGDFDSQHRPAMSHQYVSVDDDDISEISSVYHHLFTPLLSKACQYLKIPEAEIIQGRSFLQVPLNLKNRDVDTPHIDILDRNNFFVVLYYVCDSDGDTIIYNETKESDQYTIKQRVTPKKGRVVIFDGILMHTAEQPLNNTRCIVNYNLG